MDYSKMNNIFPASDWFDINFLSGFVYSAEEIKKGFNEQTYQIGDERLSSRVLNHWYETGIIDDDRPQGKGWKKFSFSEIVWIKIIFKLRSFGLDLKRIKTVKNHLDRYNKLDESSKCLLLDFYMFVALYSDNPIKFIVFESGQADIVRQIDMDLANTLETITEDFISIDINKLLNNLLTEKNVKADYLFYNETPKSPIIKQLEDSLSAEDIQSISVRIKGEEYVINEEFFTKDRIKAKALMSILKFGKLIENRFDGISNYQVINTKKIKKE